MIILYYQIYLCLEITDGSIITYEVCFWDL